MLSPSNRVRTTVADHILYTQDNGGLTTLNEYDVNSSAGKFLTDINSVYSIDGAVVGLRDGFVYGVFNVDRTSISWHFVHHNDQDRIIPGETEAPADLFGSLDNLLVYYVPPTKTDYQLKAFDTRLGTIKGHVFIDSDHDGVADRMTRRLSGIQGLS